MKTNREPETAVIFRTFKKEGRRERLMPAGIPRWIRCYDSGEGGERYTVCFTGRAGVERSPGQESEYSYRGMSEFPFHPQGVGQWGSSKNHHCDVNKWGFAPMVGRKNHLGTRVNFQDLPEDCRKLVYQDYSEIWKLNLDSLWIARRCQPHVTAEQAKAQRERINAYQVRKERAK